MPVNSWTSPKLSPLASRSCLSFAKTSLIPQFLEPCLRPRPQVRQLFRNQGADLSILGRLLFGKPPATNDFRNSSTHATLQDQKQLRDSCHILVASFAERYSERGMSAALRSVFHRLSISSRHAFRAAEGLAGLSGWSRSLDHFRLRNIMSAMCWTFHVGIVIQVPNHAGRKAIPRTPI